MPIKDFDRWNGYKKAIDSNSRLVLFHEREVWWCSIGVNVGSEQDSYSGDFSRPIVIVKKFTDGFFWGVQLTTKSRKGEFRIPIKLNEVANDMLVLQMRSLDAKRLIKKIGVLSRPEFESILIMIIKLCLENMKTPSEGVSEAEARVCTEILRESPYARSIEDHKILSTFFGDRYFSRIGVFSRI